MGLKLSKNGLLPQITGKHTNEKSTNPSKINAFLIPNKIGIVFTPTALSISISFISKGIVIKKMKIN